VNTYKYRRAVNKQWVQRVCNAQ